MSTVAALKVVKIEPAKDANAHITGAGLEPLLHASNIQDISLARMKLTSTQVGLLAEAIKQDKLRSISLMCAELDDDAAKLLGEAIAQTTSLETLDLANNAIGDDGCVALCEGLKKNESIKHCRLWGNKAIGAAGFAAIVDMLEHNTFIERLETPMTVDMHVRVKIDECLYSNRNGGVPMAA
jgi:Ran GTPase-activating protein (RanGAP) involved in mRNA processing and transport